MLRWYHGALVIGGYVQAGRSVRSVIPEDDILFHDSVLTLPPAIIYLCGRAGVQAQIGVRPMLFLRQPAKNWEVGPCGNRTEWLGRSWDKKIQPLDEVGHKAGGYQATYWLKMGLRRQHGDGVS